MNILEFTDETGRCKGIALLFENDADRLQHAHNLLNFEPKEGPRAYMVYEDDMTEEDKQHVFSYTAKCCGATGHNPEPAVKHVENKVTGCSWWECEACGKTYPDGEIAAKCCNVKHRLNLVIISR